MLETKDILKNSLCHFFNILRTISLTSFKNLPPIAWMLSITACTTCDLCAVLSHLLYFSNELVTISLNLLLPTDGKNDNSIRRCIDKQMILMHHGSPF